MPTARMVGRDAATPSSEKIASRIVMILRISIMPTPCFVLVLLDSRFSPEPDNPIYSDVSAR